MIQVTLFSRSNCHLCDQAHADLQALQDVVPHRLSIVDVDSHADLRHAYGLEVPVVEIGPYRLKAPFSRQELQITLGAAQDRERQIDAVERSPALERLRQTWTKADAFTYWFANHYLALFNLFIFLYVGLPFLAPVLMRLGAEPPARLIYRSYGMVCHQLAYRSFFLFGEQVVYPRAEAGVEGVLTFSQATGVGESSDPDELFAARDFIGNPALGYKVALCERDVSIYGAILLFGLLYSVVGMLRPTGRPLAALPWYLWILLGILPIAIDGLSQLFSQPPFNFFPVRESTPNLRVLTGFLFGFTTAWFGYPMVEQTMSETRRIMAEKRIRVKREKSET